MDPNFVQATLSGYLASSHDRDRHPRHLEQEMVAYKRPAGGPHRSLVVAMRLRIGAGLILLGEHIGQIPGPEPADNAVTS